jgi:hypothetical protein
MENNLCCPFIRPVNIGDELVSMACGREKCALWDSGAKLCCFVAISKILGVFLLKRLENFNDMQLQKVWDNKKE